MALLRRAAFGLAHLPNRFGLFASRLEVTRINVQVPALNASLGGFSIAHISDIHVGEHNWMPVHALEAARVVRDSAPNIVVNTGDFLQWEPEIEKVLRFVAPFVSAGSHDVSTSRHVAILGNHDYYADERRVQRLVAGLQDLGICVLTNESMTVRRGDGQLSFVGLTHQGGDLSRGLRVLHDAARPRIALIHEPDLVERLPFASADLVLAGHTHGGQITIPGLAPSIARRFGHTNYSEGFYTVNGMLMYVNRGLGTTGLPLRMRARPEVTLLRLVR